MKKERILFLVVLFAACQAIAQQQTNTWTVPYVSSVSASRTNTSIAVTHAAPRPKFHLFGPAPMVQPQRPLQMEGLDTRAWTTVAETRTSRQAFPTGENHQAGLCLLWWGSKPQDQEMGGH